MIPVAALSVIGIDLAEFLGVADIAPILRQRFTIAARSGPARGIFQRFVSQYIDANPGTTRDAAAQVYRQARAWSNQGAALMAYEGGVVIDPRLARPLKSAGRYAGEFGGFRTTVTARLTDKVTGDVFERNVHVNSDRSETRDDLMVMAADELADILDTSPILGRSRTIDEFDVQYRITDFGRYS